MEKERREEEALDLGVAITVKVASGFRCLGETETIEGLERDILGLMGTR